MVKLKLSKIRWGQWNPNLYKVSKLLYDEGERAARAIRAVAVLDRKLGKRKMR
jgi:hypothetical protein